MAIGRPKHNEYSSNILSIDSSSRQQSAYDKLSDESFNRTMGILSTDNKRWLELQPGSYSGGLTLNNVNIGVKEAIPNTVSIAGKIRNTANAPCIIGGINSLTKTLTIDSSLGRYNSLQEAYNDLAAGLVGNNPKLKILGGTYASQSLDTSDGSVEVIFDNQAETTGVSLNNISNVNVNKSTDLQTVVDDTITTNTNSFNRLTVTRSSGTYTDSLVISDNGVDVVNIGNVQDAGIIVAENVDASGAAMFRRADNDYQLLDNAGVVLADDKVAKDSFALASTITLEDVTVDGSTDWNALTEDDDYVYITKAGSYALWRASKITGVFEDTGSTGIRILHSINTGVYAGRLIGFSSTYEVSYSDDNGTTWTAATTDIVYSNASASVVQNWSIADNGSVIVVSEYSEGKQIHYSSDGGDTWAVAFDANTDIVDTFDFEQSSVPTSTAREQFWKDTDDDKVYVSYKAGSTAITDLGWRLIIDHFHTIQYHAGMGMFVAFSGDSTVCRYQFRSTDGISWSVYADSRKNVQPIQLVDYGDSECLICGSDAPIGVFKYNLSDNTYHHLTDNWVHDVTPNYAWSVQKSGDLFWSGSFFNQAETTQAPMISVSKDNGETWAIIAYTELTDRGVENIAGVANGYMYCTVQANDASSRLVRVKEPTVVNSCDLIRLSPNSENAYYTENLSIGNTSNASFSESANKAVFEHGEFGGLFDENCLKVTDGSDDCINALGISTVPSAMVQDGRQYQARLYVRGDTECNVASFEQGTGLNTYGLKCLFSLFNEDEWLEVLTPPHESPVTGDTSTKFAVNAKVGASATPNTDYDARLFFGGWHTDASRGGFQMGGDARLASRLVDTIDADGRWTNTFTIIPDNRSKYLGQFAAYVAETTYADGTFCTVGGYTFEALQEATGQTPDSATPGDTAYWKLIDDWRWHIATWQQDSNNRITVYFNSNTGKFCADIVVGGTKEDTLVMSASQYFEWKSPIRIALRLDDTFGSEKISLTVAAGNSVLHDSSSDAQVKAAIQGSNYMRNRKIDIIRGDQVSLGSVLADASLMGDMITMPMYCNAIQTCGLLSDANLASAFALNI